jgi:hypothetical protein
VPDVREGVFTDAADVHVLPERASDHDNHDPGLRLRTRCSVQLPVVVLRA